MRQSLEFNNKRATYNNGGLSATLETYLASESSVTEIFASGSGSEEEARSRRLQAKQLEVEALAQKVSAQ